MKVYRSIDSLPLFKNAVVTIGTFDGVHTGHQQVLAQLKKAAADTDGETVIITFDPHPRTVINQASGIRIINTIEEKIALLEGRGIDHLVITPFTEKFARMSAEEYIRDFLVKNFQPRTIIIGYDHHFGQGRTGNYELLKKAGSEFNYKLYEIPAHVLDAISVSSTRIRQAIGAGDMVTANALLGYPFFFEGVVVSGDRRGRTIGYPTANLELRDAYKLLPADGVYAVDVQLQGIPEKLFQGMMNIGFRPTVDGTRRVIEVNIFDFDAMIYGETLRVTVKSHLRGEKKFDSLESLQAQLAEDKKAAGYR
jgi:riboflavin kinase / FMN adenylyltransferase